MSVLVTVTQGSKFDKYPSASLLKELFILTLFVSLGQKYAGMPCKMTTRGVIQTAALKPKDLTIVLTLSAKVLDVIFLPGT